MRSAAIVFVTALWISLLVGAAFTGGIRSIAFEAILVVILMAGLLLGFRASLLFIGLTLLCGGAISYFEVDNLLPAAYSENSVAGVLSNRINLFLFAALLMHLAVRELRNSLTQTRRHRETLAELNRKLHLMHNTVEEQILERTTGFQEANQRLQIEIDEHRRTGSALAERVGELEFVALVGATVSKIPDAERMVRAVVHMIQNSLKHEQLQIYLLSEDSEHLQLKAATGSHGKELLNRKWQIPIEHAVALPARVAASRVGQILDCSQEPDYFSPNPSFTTLRTELAVPIVLDEKLFGIIDLQSSSPHGFGDDDLRLYKILADLIAASLRNNMQMRRTEEMLSETRDLYLISLLINTANGTRDLLDLLRQYTVLRQATHVSTILFHEVVSGTSLNRRETHSTLTWHRGKLLGSRHPIFDVELLPDLPKLQAGELLFVPDLKVDSSGTTSFMNIMQRRCK